MSDMNLIDVKPTPWHLWVVGVVALVWNGMGAMDYVMSQTHNEAYMSGFTPEQLEFFYRLPAWAVAAWATGVWCGVAGAIVLLLKRRQAVVVFLASLIGAVLMTFHNYVLINGMEIAGDAFSLAFAALIILVALGLYLYSRAMHKRKILV